MTGNTPEPMEDKVMSQILSVLSGDPRFDAVTRRGGGVCMERAGVCRIWVRRRPLGGDPLVLTVEADRWLDMFGSWQRAERASCPPYHRHACAGVPWATGAALDIAKRLMAAHNARLLDPDNGPFAGCGVDLWGGGEGGVTVVRGDDSVFVPAVRGVVNAEAVAAAIDGLEARA